MTLERVPGVIRNEKSATIRRSRVASRAGHLADRNLEYWQV